MEFGLGEVILLLAVLVAEEEGAFISEVAGVDTTLNDDDDETVGDDAEIISLISPDRADASDEMDERFFSTNL